MSTYYLRIEAVNFDHFLGDTHDLSTIRGGGLLMLDAIEKAVSKDSELHEVYIGASTGLFTFERPDANAAEDKRREVQTRLHQGALQEGTLMVDILPSGDLNTGELLAALTTKNRLRQMTAPSVIMPAEGGNQVCEVSDLRPAAESISWKDGSPKQVSSAVLERRKYGIKQKFHFYKEHSRIDAEYVNELDHLTGRAGHDRDQGLLQHKLALIYLDGNKFGEILRDCASDERLGAWSKQLQESQNEFLSHVLKKAVTDPDWQWSGEETPRIRLETLLWGGDEIIWVVPAWKGWWMLGEFFKTFGHVDGKPTRLTFSPDGVERKLTHGASIVFAHHHAPIHRLRDLAEKLAHRPKVRGKKEPMSNWFTYQVLESFDHLGTDPDTTRQNRLPEGVDLDALSLPGDGMQEIPDILDRFRKEFPKSKLTT